MAGDYAYAAQSIRRLLHEQPERAADILEKCYLTYKEIKDEIDWRLQLTRPGFSQASRPLSSSAIPTPSHGSVRGHRRPPSLQLADSQHRLSGKTTSHAAPTPPGSSSARSSKASSASGEMILLIDAQDEGVEQRAVFLRTDAAVQYSLIREDIVNEHMTSAVPKEDDRQFTIVLPEDAVNPGIRKDIRISVFATLTWHRSKAHTTHRTDFFLVPKHVLSTDAFLGYEDSGKSNPGFLNAVAAPNLQRQGYREINEGHEKPSPTVVPPSFHRSQFELTPLRTQSWHQYSQHATESHQSHPAAHGLSEEKQQSVQPSTIHTSGNAHSTPEMPNRRLRLSLKWGPTPLNLWLDLDSSAEVFYQALRDASKRRKVNDWTSGVIWLKAEPQSSDDSAYLLALGEELDADWGVTVEWLEQNRREKSPHISGWVEFEDGS